jgi:hypothetical protein
VNKVCCQVPRQPEQLALLLLLLLLCVGWLQADIPTLRLGMAVDMLQGAVGW